MAPASALGVRAVHSPPPPTNSESVGISLVITGLPDAQASRMTLGKISVADGKQTILQDASAASRTSSGTLPVSTIRWSATFENNAIDSFDLGPKKMNVAFGKIFQTCGAASISRS